MKKGTLGARLLQTMDAERSARLEQVLELSAGKELTSPSEEQVRQVRGLFASAKARIKALIDSESPLAISVQIGEEGAVAGNDRNRAIDVLSNACWPLTICEGVQVPTNPFNADWKDLCRWALKEELFAELHAVYDERVVRTRHYVRVRPIPV